MREINSLMIVMKHVSKREQERAHLDTANTILSYL